MTGKRWFRAGQFVVCVNDVDCLSQLESRCTYRVVEHMRDVDELKLLGVRGTWKATRFVPLEAHKGNNPPMTKTLKLKATA